MPPLDQLRRAAGRLLAVILLAACSAPAGRTDPGAEERAAIADTLRRLVVAAHDLSGPGDAVSRLLSLYPPGGGVVSASGGQLTTSRGELESGIRAFWENVGRNMRDPKWAWDTMHVEVLSRDAAALTTTYHVPHLTPAGQPHVIAGALTAVFQRRDGRWVIVQEHLSDRPRPAPSDSSAEHQH